MLLPRRKSLRPLLSFQNVVDVCMVALKRQVTQVICLKSQATPHFFLGQVKSEVKPSRAAAIPAVCKRGIKYYYSSSNDIKFEV